MATAERMYELEAEARRLVDAAAPAEAFNPLWREGWRPASMREGNGLDPCPSDCGVCYPAAPKARRSRR